MAGIAPTANSFTHVQCSQNWPNATLFSLAQLRHPLEVKSNLNRSNFVSCGKSSTLAAKRLTGPPIEGQGYDFVCRPTCVVQDCCSGIELIARRTKSALASQLFSVTFSIIVWGFFGDYSSLRGAGSGRDVNRTGARCQAQRAFSCAQPLSRCGFSRHGDPDATSAIICRFWIAPAALCSRAALTA